MLRPARPPTGPRTPPTDHETMTKPALSAEPSPSFRPLYLQIKDLLVRSL